MKIAVNTRLVIKNKMDGIGLFTWQTFSLLAKQHPEIDFYFIFDRKPDEEFLAAKNIHPIIIRPITRHIYVFPYWYQIALKRILKKLNPDIFIATDGMFPLNSNIKTLVIIHDLNFEHHPELLPKNVLNYYKKYFPKFAQQANQIATVSEFSKNDIVQTYKIEASKISVVFNGASKKFKPISEVEKQIVKDKFTEGVNYFLFVGTIHPRKNVPMLLKAFNQFKTESGTSLKLLIAGKKMWSNTETAQLLNELAHKKDIIFTGRVNDNELAELTAAAKAITYIPIFEGFGIPLLEGMQCGVPVITSNITSMPEVVGDAGILVNPFNQNEIAQAMQKITADNNFHKELSSKSILQATKFSWEKTAQLVMESINKTIR
ncbi:MAG: glycosyltransferase family 4 protein [Flavobacteriales bacterium]|nr:glycosyltransferase family 4 protein [Flavobacteriales bacterium]MCW8912013.1 glycosyltransferase family 4 protein [Flavobacteriales bacterium]MCW8936653.1 glycosyltransferase family 4 protein [Flavobacteriales bacterium]MCW8939552.1 glycosyltransferase family 4 protein [Flavobacteriales bacterium]MCW8969601.1 glycosyltransferase family 4 protein [Flavobacteriales bacterium]